MITSSTDQLTAFDPSCLGDAPPLTQFYLYLSMGCNLACRHCWITPAFVNGKPSPGDILDVDLLRMAVEEAKPLGLVGAKLTGGEPMLHPRFLEIVDLLTTQGLSLSMETNGTLLDADTASYLKNSTSVNSISISIDGATSATHDAFRGVPGAFERASRGLKSLVDAGYKNVQVITSVFRGNIRELEAIVEWAADQGAASVKFNPVQASGRGTQMHKRGEALDLREVIDLIHYVNGPLRKKASVRLVIMAPPAALTISELLYTKDKGDACGVRHVLGILGTGEIALCGIGRTMPELIYGFLGQSSIRDVWVNHPALLQLRRDLDDIDNYPGICGKCIHARTCLTHCVAQNYLNTRHLVWPSPICEQMAQQNTFPVSRLRNCESS